MAGKIKGITIEIAGDTRPLNKALEDVNSKSKNLQAELRQVERLLKFNPGNTELLAQKQKLLADQVFNTREKLERLKSAQEQVNEQFRKGEIGEGQYRIFQREIVETEGKLKQFEAQLAKTKKTLSDYGKSIQDAGEKMASMGKKMSMKVTAPVLGLGAVVVKTGMDFEAAMSEVGAISGAAGEDLKSLEALAKEMGKTTKFSASEAADGLKYMAMAGWETQQMLDALPGVLSLAAASGEELGTVSDIVTDAMTAFGMEAARAGEFADVLAAASSGSNTNVSMLGQSFKYVAPLAGALGYEAKDAAIALGLMANAGIKSSQSGTAMRSMLTRLVKPTAESGKAMDELGISLTKSDGGMKSLAEVMKDLRAVFKNLEPEQQAFYAAQIAGQEAMSGMLAIVNASEDDFNKLSDYINNSTGAAAKMSKEMQDNLKGRLTELKSAIEGVALQLYDAMQPAIEKVVAAVKKLVDWLGNLSPGMQAAIVTVAALAAAIGPLLILFGFMAQGLGALIGMTKTLASIIPTLGTVFAALTSPIGIAVAAIIGLIAIIAFLRKHWEDIRNFTVAVWDGIKNTLINIWNSVKDTATQIWGFLKEFFAENGKAILLLAVGPVGWAVLLAQKLSQNWDSIKQIAITAWGNIKTNISQIWDNIVSGITGTVGKVTAIVKDGLENVWDYIKSIPGQALQWGKDIINGLITGIKSLKIPTPHFDFTVGQKTVAGINLPAPIVDVNWYKSGGIFNRPAVIGVGDTPEAVVPLEKLQPMLTKSLVDAIKSLKDDPASSDSQPLQLTVTLDSRIISQQLYRLQQGKLRGQGV